MRTTFKSLLRSERGNAFALAAAAMPLILASAGFAIDTIHFASMKRQMQRAADSSAIAGAFALSQDVSAETAVERDLGRNNYPALSTAQRVTVAPALGFEQAVRVQLVAQPRLAFMSIFTRSSSQLTGEATAALVDGGEFCVLSLYNGTNAGIDVSGGAQVDLGCGMAANARGPASITAGGSSLVNASPLMAVGGLDGSTSNFDGPVKLQPYSAEQRDPFADVPDPPPQFCNNVEVVSPSETKTLSPGCYKSLDFKGTAHLQPGTYYINGGDLEFSSQTKVTGSGVTFVMTGPNGAAGDLRMNGGANLDLTAPSSGEYAGLLFYRDRRAANIEIKINGGSSSKMVGAYYLASSDVTFNGDAGLQVRCFQMVGQILKFQGGAEISNDCPDLGTAPNFNLKYVRLIS